VTDNSLACPESTGKSLARRSREPRHDLLTPRGHADLEHHRQTQLERERAVANMSALPISFSTEVIIPIHELGVSKVMSKVKVNALYTGSDVKRQRQHFLKCFGLRRSVRFSPAHRSARAPGRRPVRVRRRSGSASHSARASGSSGSRSLSEKDHRLS